MLSKNEIKYIQSLSHKKFRDSFNLFLAEGPKIVSELVQLIPDQIEKIYATEEWLQDNKVIHPGVTVISEQELERISQLQTPNQVLATVKKKELPPISDNGFTIYLDTIQDPGNFGTIIRTADWFGISQIVCTAGCADLYQPKVVQSTMASIARVNVYYDDQCSWLKNQQQPVYAAVLDGNPVEKAARVNNGVLIIGNESKGISPELMNYATEKITISKKGEAESLNAAVATGILLSYLVS